MLIFTLYFLILVLIGFRVWTFLAAKNAEKKFPPQGTFIHAGGQRVHYLRKGKGPSLVLIHGAYGSMRDFTHSIFEPLTHEFDVTVFDRPGLGFSQRIKKNSSLEGQVTLIKALIEELGLQQPLLVGHSLGAGLGLAYAVKYPGGLSGIVSIGGYAVPPELPLDPIYTVPGIPVLGPFIVDTFLGPIGTFAAKSVAEGVFYPELIPKNFLEMSSALALRAESFKDNARDVRELIPFLTPLMARYQEIKVPVTLVTGDSDLVALPERHAVFLKKSISNSELIMLPKTGHQPCFTRTDEIVTIIRNASRKIEACR